MFEILTSKAAVILSYCVIFLFKVLYAVTIYKKCDHLSKKQRNILTYLSLPLPVITGIICIVKCKKQFKKQITLFLMLVITLVAFILSVLIISYNNEPKFYDSKGDVYTQNSDVLFYDTNGNEYAFNFAKSGYDRLYINGTDEYLNSDLCYLDETGCLVYDEDMSITAHDERSCVDENGTVYYPVKYSTFGEDGSVNYSFNSANFSYDRFKNAYIYDRVPYYDENLNKYLYSFDSNLQKGFYTNISTGEKFENEYCFVDKEGYLVYDKDHVFTEIKNENGTKIYSYISGEIYFWASGIFWDKNGNMIDSFGTILSNINI